uniref:DUF488 domain-containing protein n=1 Tax=Azospirillum argentinense TaxID=2970906 RepID=UPI002000216F|nr:DUF488 domain-containing protein [Azospirillum argentinense]
MASNTLFTIGYEGVIVDDFLETLRKVGVQTLIDIRDVPVSRRPGFSKSALAQRSGDAGIIYTHLRALGDPKEGREAARAGRYETFRTIFTAHLGTQGAQAALNEAIEIANDTVACLLCYERDHRFCHRALVAAEMNRLGGFSLKHIGVPQRK